MGYSLSRDEIDKAFNLFLSLADKKKEITDHDLDAIVNSITIVPEYYRLDTFQIQSGNRMQAMASVTLLYDEKEKSEAATGDGPIDAAYNAVVRIVGGDWPLVSYDIRAVTEGMDALGEVTVRVKHGDEIHVGRGLSTDIMEASIRAYVHAINREKARAAKQD